MTEQDETNSFFNPGIRSNIYSSLGCGLFWSKAISMLPLKIPFPTLRLFCLGNLPVLHSWNSSNMLSSSWGISQIATDLFTHLSALRGWGQLSGEVRRVRAMPEKHRGPCQTGGSQKTSWGWSSLAGVYKQKCSETLAGKTMRTGARPWEHRAEAANRETKKPKLLVQSTQKKRVRELSEEQGSEPGRDHLSRAQCKIKTLLLQKQN